MPETMTKLAVYLLKLRRAFDLRSDISSVQIDRLSTLDILSPLLCPLGLLFLDFETAGSFNFFSLRVFLTSEFSEFGLLVIFGIFAFHK